MNIPIGDSFQVCISKPCEAHENKHIPIGPLTFMVQLYMNHFLQFVAYVVKLLPIAIELIEKYKGINERKISPEHVFPVGKYQALLGSLKYIGKKCGCKVEVTPHIGRHTFAVLAILKGMPLETLQKVLGHNSILSTHFPFIYSFVLFYEFDSDRE